MADRGTGTEPLSERLFEAAWSGRHPGDSLYGLTPLPVDLVVKVLFLAATMKLRGE